MNKLIILYSVPKGSIQRKFQLASIDILKYVSKYEYLFR